MRDVLLALFLLTAFPMVIYRFQVGALIIGFISFMYPQSNTFGFALSVQWIDIFLVLTAVGYFLKQGYMEYRHHPLITLAICLYIWICVTTLFTMDMIYSYDPWLKFSKILLLAYVVYAMLGNEKRLIAFLKVMVICFGFYGIKGGIFTLISGGGHYVLGPINSFYADNNGMSLVLTMTLPFMIFFFTHASNIYQKYFSLFCTLCTTFAILGTQSRTGFVAMVITLLYLTWLQKKVVRSMLILVPVAIIGFFFMPATWSDRISTTTELESDASFQGRVDMWRVSVDIANDHPLVGGGFDVIYMPEAIIKYVPLETEARAIHSAYFQMMAEHGYIGFAIFAYLLFYTFRTAQRMSRQVLATPNLDWPWMQDLTIAIRASLVAYMVQALTSNIAFFELMYFIVIVTAISDNMLQAHLYPQKNKAYQPQFLASAVSR